jgi:serine/threonine protein kinase
MKEETKLEESPQDEIFLWFWEKHERGDVLKPEVLLAELQSNFGLDEAKAKRFLDEFLELADFSGQHESEDTGTTEVLTLSSFLHYELNANVPCRRGGLASVHKAHDHRFDRPVAIKVPLKRFAHENEVRSRIMREARLSARLQHPNIVPIYEFGESGPAGHPFFVMKYVEGKTLLEAINASSPDIASMLRLLKVVRETVGALEHAHSRGIIHRDIKPENIMIGQFNESHLLDFGCADEIAAIQEQKSFRTRAIERFSQTVEGGVFGTYAYMAPEQAKGHLHKQCGKTDVFGIGGLLCHILTGRPVYCGTSAEVIDAAKNWRTENAFIRIQAKSVPKVLQKLTMACLQTEPDQRPDAAEVGRILDTFFDSIAKESVRNERRARWATFGLMAALLAISVFTGLGVLYDQYMTESVAEASAWNLNETWAQQRLLETEMDRQQLAQYWREIATEPIPIDVSEKLYRLQSAVERIESILQPAEAYPETMDLVKQLKSSLELDREALQSEQARFDEARLDRETTVTLLRDLSDSYLRDERIALEALIGGRLRSVSILLDIERSFQAIGIDIRKNPSDRGKVWIEKQTDSQRRDLSLHLFRQACIANDEGDAEFCNSMLNWANELDPREELKPFRSMVKLEKTERQKAFDQWKADFPNARSPTVEILSIVLELAPSPLQTRDVPLSWPLAAYTQPELLIATHYFVRQKIEQESFRDPWEMMAYLRGCGLEVDLWEMSLFVSIEDWESIKERYFIARNSTQETILLNPLIAFAAAKLDDDAKSREVLASSNASNLSTLVAEVLALIELERFEQAQVRLEASKKQRFSQELYSLLSLKLELAFTADVQQSQWETKYPELVESLPARTFWIEYLLKHQRFQNVLELVYSDIDKGKVVPRTIVAGIEAAVRDDQWLDARDLFILLLKDKLHSGTLRALAHEILSVDGAFDLPKPSVTPTKLGAISRATVLNEFITRGNEIEAVKMISGFTERDLQDPETSRAVARGYLIIDKLGLTDEPMLEHVARYPKDLEARLMLHGYYLEYDRPEEGRMQLDAAFKSGQDAPLHVQLALFDCLSLSGEKSLAEQLLKRLLFSEKNANEMVQVLKRQVHSSNTTDK